MRKKRTLFFLIIIVIGIIFLSIGSTIIIKNSTNNNSNLDLDNKKHEEKNKSMQYIKDYSKYENFSVLTTMDIVFEDEYDWFVSIHANINLNKKIIKIESYDGNNSNFVYYKLNDKLHYYSFNGKKWMKNINNEMTLPDYSDIINKIKSNKKITSNGNNSYSLTYEYKLESGDITTVPINVVFDEEGYLKQITYDLTKINNSYKKYIKTRSFFDINNTEFAIPDDVVNDSITGAEVITLGF